MIKKLHQIFISDNNILPDILKERTEILKETYSDFDYTLYNNDSIVDFLEKNFDKDVLKAYHKFVPYTYKADLARYCILYELGGMYSDLPLHNFNRDLFPIDGYEYIVFHDGGNPALAGGLIYANEVHLKYLEKTINIVVENCKNNFYGDTFLHPASSFPLGDGLKHYHNFYYDGIDTDVILKGNLVVIDDYYHFVFKDKIVCKGKHIHHGGSISGLGASGNNYMELWRQNKIYHTEDEE